ncbi:TPA: hypothetical protein JI044_03305 [Acinetobacter baumannii]|nr:hypothetical protein [Acinetobacter baumannii]HAV5297473.1 hypothetical protein [Acinetobacter baumannii]HAV5399301.1 hypothetical protein [Acinetobacter baumannii]
MLVDSFYPSLYSQSFQSNVTSSTCNSYILPSEYNKDDNDVTSEKLDTKLVGNLQPNLLNLFFLLCLISTSYSLDSISSYGDKLNPSISIAPEVYKSSQEFWRDPKHYLEVYKLESTNQGRSASAYMTVLMHHAVRSGDIKFLNTFFEKLNMTQLTFWSLIALLRSTSVYKQDIALWKDFYVFTRELIESSGLNPKRELYGLDRGLSF